MITLAINKGRINSTLYSTQLPPTSQCLEVLQLSIFLPSWNFNIGMLFQQSRLIWLKSPQRNAMYGCFLVMDPGWWNEMKGFTSSRYSPNPGQGWHVFEKAALVMMMLPFCAVSYRSDTKYEQCVLSVLWGTDAGAKSWWWFRITESWKMYDLPQ